MGKTLSRNKEIPTFFGEIQLKGERQLVDFMLTDVMGCDAANRPVRLPLPEWPLS